MKIKHLTLKFAFIALSAFVSPAFCQNYENCHAYYPAYETTDTEQEDDVYQSYRYASLGVGPVIFIPNVGIGYRERYAKLGWDTSISFSSIGYAHQLSALIAGHCYLNPAKKNSIYFGLGLLGSGIITNHGDGGFTLSPDLIFGKEFGKKGERRQFIEMHVGIPSLFANSRHAHAMYIPLMYIKYGFAF